MTADDDAFIKESHAHRNIGRRIEAHRAEDPLAHQTRQTPQATNAVKKATDEYNQLVADVAGLIESSAGRNVLRLVCRESGFMQPSLAADNLGVVNTNMTLVNEARRGVWFSIRKFIRPDKLALIENYVPGMDAADPLQTDELPTRKRKK